MSDNDIQEVLDKLGLKVSKIAEENRVYKLNESALKEYISQLSQFISKEDWVKLYESENEPFVKDLMKEWGANLFPENYNIK